MELEEAFTPESPVFVAHMLALGRLCVISAYVDRLLTDLIQVFLGCTDAQAAIIATQNDRTASRCKMIKSLAAENSPGKAWLAALNGLIDHLFICGEKRNRYVHDQWSVESGSLARKDRRASVKKPQSHGEPKLVFDTKHVTPPEDVTDLAVLYAITAFCLHGAKKDLEAWKQSGQLPTPSLLLLTARDHPPQK